MLSLLWEQPGLAAGFGAGMAYAWLLFWWIVKRGLPLVQGWRWAVLGIGAALLALACGGFGAL